MKTHLLEYLRKVGLLNEVPTSKPEPRTVLARGVCPLHDDADNRNAFLLFADGFACETKDCHRKGGLGLNLEGLIRRLVHRHSGEVMPWRAAWSYALRNAEAIKEMLAEKVRPSRPSPRTPSDVSYTAEDLAACLAIPDPFYLSRGYRPETLAHFGVGRCVRPLPDRKTSLVGWSVFPVLDGQGRSPLGYTARDPRWTKESDSQKWYHGVQRSQSLYNLHNARQGERKAVFICEGPPCVMRFYEAGFANAVATMGNSLSEEQAGQVHHLLSREGQKFYIAADADEGGLAFAESVVERIGGLAEPTVILPLSGFKDFGDIPASDLPRAISEAARMEIKGCSDFQKLKDLWDKARNGAGT